MRKKDVDEILASQAKRRNIVFGLVAAIIVVSIIAFAFFVMYLQGNKKQYVSYDESSKIDYKVYLKENSFFENNYLESNKQYIASLIDHINANFKYELSLEEKNVEYKYTYRIEAVLDVKEDDTNKSLYNKTYELLSPTEKKSNRKEVVVNENVSIDYNYYNDLIYKFVTTYGLSNIESVLTVNMYVSIIGYCEEFEDNQSQESVMSLSIPLTTKTVAIDLSDNLINNENLVIQCKTSTGVRYLYLVVAILFIISDICLIAFTIKYEIDTRTAETIYEKEMKKILNNYGSYIQTLGNGFDFEGYQLLKVKSFTDMLEIRDTIRQPILLKENSRKTGAYFVIPSSTKILYVYRLKVSDIKKQIKDNKGGDLKF